VSTHVSIIGAAALGPPTAEDRKRLFDILLERSLRFGDFTLSSGAKSKYYIDVRQTSLHPEGSLLIAKFLYPLVKESGVEGVGGLTMGADPIAGAIALWSQLHGAPMSGFIVRKEAKAHGAARRVEGPFREGMKVAIVDDVITKGGSALQALDAVREAGGDVRLVACVVDRGEGGPEEFASRGVPFRSLFHIREFLEGRV
jgi:orotate phosphoribosyltransferase